jgi:hypothetical protein
LAGPFGAAFRGAAERICAMAGEIVRRNAAWPLGKAARRAGGPTGERTSRPDHAPAGELARLRGRGDSGGAVIDRCEILPRGAGGVFVVGLHGRGGDVLLMHRGFIQRGSVVP